MSLDIGMKILTSTYLSRECFFFLFKLRHAARSTLFPYTTLFRSGRIHPLDVVETQLGDEREIEPHLFAPPRDRKSTRLNSSHITSSYAVFCLKKKKRQETDSTDICIHEGLNPTYQPALRIVFDQS